METIKKLLLTTAIVFVMSFVGVFIQITLGEELQVKFLLYIIIFQQIYYFISEE